MECFELEELVFLAEKVSFWGKKIDCGESYPDSCFVGIINGIFLETGRVYRLGKERGDIQTYVCAYPPSFASEKGFGYYETSLSCKNGDNEKIRTVHRIAGETIESVRWKDFRSELLRHTRELLREP